MEYDTQAYEEAGKIFHGDEAKTDSQLAGVVECLIDRFGLAPVLSALAHSAYGKADHLRTNWQDHATAKMWDKAAKALDAGAERIHV